MENIFVTAVGSLKHLKNHPILFLPGIVYPFLILFLSLVFGVFSIFLPASNLLLSAAVSVFSLFLTAMLLFFTTAGLIGAAGQTVRFGSTSFSDIIRYGRKFCLRLALASVFIWALRSLSAFFWAPVIRLFFDSEYTAAFVIETLKTDPLLLLPLFEILGPTALSALFLSSAYFILISFMFYFVSFIIVIDNKSVFKSYRESFSLLKKRPIRVVSFVFLMTLVRVLFVLLLLISAAVFLYLQIPQIIGLIFQTTASVFFTAFTTVWITRFYIILTRQKTADI